MVRIVTDSGAHLPTELFQEYGITVVPLVVNMGGRTYYEGEDLDLETFYQYLRTSPALPTTSQPPVGRFYEVYRQLSEAGDPIVSIHLSSALSGTYATAVAAREMLPEAEIHVVDTRLISVPQGILVLEAARMARAGATVREILRRLEFMKAHTVFYFILDTLEYLAKGGRVSNIQALVGNLLQLKPILKLHEGRIEAHERVRTTQRARARLQELIREYAQGRRDLRIGVMHTRLPEVAEEIARALREELRPTEIFIAEAGPAVATHAGPGGLGLACYGEPASGIS
ncbi:DegV family protein [Thermoflexus sp.]|uniref:DegV family protein n=1 Tax=Thermoflexus sp. TaxID=1969742 RepID=UPI002ADD6385|nr:DegV family protein [Thermoflexus sp.]